MQILQWNFNNTMIRTRYYLLFWMNFNTFSVMTLIQLPRDLQPEWILGLKSEQINYLWILTGTFSSKKNKHTATSVYKGRSPFNCRLYDFLVFTRVVSLLVTGSASLRKTYFIWDHDRTGWTSNRLVRKMHIIY
jgi:hypothetical protein